MLRTLGIAAFVVVTGVGLGKVIKEPIQKLTGTTAASPSPQSTPSLPLLPSPSPVAVPLSGVLENYATERNLKETSPSTNEGSGRLRIYSAPIKEPDGSGFHDKCSESENNALLKRQHYFVRVADWKSNQMVTTAFIRAGEKVALKLDACLGVKPS